MTKRRIALAVADGAGGTSGGAEAADVVIRSVQSVAAERVNAEACARLLRTLDPDGNAESKQERTTFALRSDAIVVTSSACS